MMMTTAVAVRLPEALQALVDSRLDTIDRMLMGRVPRQDRLSIVREVEAQVFELLQERDAEDLSREDVLAVLARLDPPEAYLPEETGVEPMAPRMAPRPHAVQSIRKGDFRAAKASGILGLVAMALALLSPILGYAIAIPLQSIVALCVGCGSVSGLAIVSSTIAFVLAIYSRMASAWAIVGMVTSCLSLLGAIALPFLAFFVVG
jgi:hypothetical protein